MRLPLVSDVDVWVLRDRCLRTVSGWEQSSTKQDFSVRRKGAWAELTAKVTLVEAFRRLAAWFLLLFDCINLIKVILFSLGYCTQR